MDQYTVDLVVHGAEFWHSGAIIEHAGIITTQPVHTVIAGEFEAEVANLLQEFSIVS